MCKLILLGGIPGVGKTTIAYRLASIYKIDKVLIIDILKNVSFWKGLITIPIQKILITIERKIISFLLLFFFIKI